MAKNDIVTPSTLPGFSELIPVDQLLFNKMKDTIRGTYEDYGFIPLDTPIIERAEVLLAKSGGDTEKQIYRFKKGTTDMALRFDLTVPLARYVAQHCSELTFPFRRYHIGKVFRGERSQRGRFREFYQCDIDIIGNESLNIVYDAEILNVIYATFRNLGFEDFTIKINNRKILNGFFESLKIQNKADIVRVIDKLEKIGEDGVIKELHDEGLNDDNIKKILDFIKIKGSNEEILKLLKSMKIENPVFKTGLQELSTVVDYIRFFDIPNKNCLIDLKIARGLDYYTGTVYETFLDDYSDIGSICSGGRYDNLAEHYINQKFPGVGISIGLTRLFYQLKEAKMLEQKASSTLTKVLVVPMDENHNEYSIKIANTLQDANIVVEVYFEDGRVGKKLSYANKLGIPYVILVGDNELESKKPAFKNMESGEQRNLDLDEIIKTIENKG